MMLNMIGMSSILYTTVRFSIKVLLRPGMRRSTLINPLASQYKANKRNGITFHSFFRSTISIGTKYPMIAKTDTTWYIGFFMSDVTLPNRSAMTKYCPLLLYSVIVPFEHYA